MEPSPLLSPSALPQMQSACLGASLRNEKPGAAQASEYGGGVAGEAEGEPLSSLAPKTVGAIGQGDNFSETSVHLP